MDMEVSKGGKTWLDMSVTRNLRGGFSLRVRADERIENFFKENNGDKEPPIDITNWTTKWRARDPKKPIKVYALNQVDPSSSSSSTMFDALGYALLNNKSVNLSFLRFAGISDADGVEFDIAGPVSADFVNEFTSRTSDAIKMFIRNYISQINLNIRITSL